MDTYQVLSLVFTAMGFVTTLFVAFIGLIKMSNKKE